MIHEIHDERYHIVEEAIYDAFFLVLKEKSIEKITVSDVIKKAGIVRSTFYNHYENIPDLVASIEDNTIQDIFAMLKSFQAKDDTEMCRSFYLTLCNYTKLNPFLASLLRSPRGDEFFYKAITMFHQYVTNVTQNKILPEHTKEVFSYMIASSIGSTIGVLHKWTSENFKVPAETIADILTQIFMAGALPFIAKE